MEPTRARTAIDATYDAPTDARDGVERELAAKLTLGAAGEQDEYDGERAGEAREWVVRKRVEAADVDDAAGPGGYSETGGEWGASGWK